MTKFYATQDFDGYHIEENANIAVFDTREEAEAFTRLPHERGGGLEEGETLTVEVGDFSDCWIKSHKKPRVGDYMLKPFSFTDVHIQNPGQHPGGTVYWLTPSRDVLVAVSTFADSED